MKTNCLVAKNMCTVFICLVLFFSNCCVLSAEPVSALDPLVQNDSLKKMDHLTIHMGLIDADHLYDLEINPLKYGPHLCLANHTVPEPAGMLLLGTGTDSTCRFQKKARENAW